MSLRGTASEVAEQLVLLYPVHLRGLLLLLGMDLQLFLRRRSAEAHLSEGVHHPAAFFIRQLGDIDDNSDIFFSNLNTKGSSREDRLHPPVCCFRGC